MQYKKIKLKENNNKIKSSTKDSLLDELLVSRNIVSEKEIHAFLNPSKEFLISPFAFVDMQKAVDRIKLAIKKQEKILVWGDFDCDGVTSSAVLYKALKFLNADVITFIPDRLLHGHGLNSKELLNFISKQKVKLVITVDCATSNVAEINLLKAFNVDVIITDHHSTDTELPNAFAIINPQVKNAIKEDENVDNIASMTCNSGSVIAYKLSMALLNDIQNDDLKEELLLIASCGAIADVVPLIGENRSMIYCALELLNSKKEKSHKGIYKLLSQNVADRNITSTDVAFILAPRINAVGRLANASLSFEFLTTEDENKLDFIIEKLNNYNAIRQSKCAETYDEIKEYLNKNKDEMNKPAVILINENWHIGIIGIVAAKIVEEYQKPCFLMTVDENNNARCSIRSNDSINVYDVLKENQDLFLGFGGHKLAGGCSFNLAEKNFDDVKKALLKTIKETRNNDVEENVLYADVELEPNDLELNIFDTLDKLEPYGQDNPQPIFVMFDVNLEEIKLIGKEQNHLRLTISKNGKKFSCLKWNENEMLIPLNSKCDIAFFPKINTFNDATSIQLEIIDMYSSDVTPKNSVKNEIKLFDHRKKDGILEKIAQYLKDKDSQTVVWAKTQQAKEKLVKYGEITSKIIQNYSEFQEVLFFDYPSNEEEFIEILNEIQPNKVHFMKIDIDENIDNYIKQFNGMIKYCLNKLNGEIDIKRMSLALGVSENFVQLSFEILENIKAVKFGKDNRIAEFSAYDIKSFKNNTMYELLNEEFESILNYKKSMLACDFKNIENLIANII